MASTKKKNGGKIARFEWYPQTLVAGGIGFLTETDSFVKDIESGKFTKASDVHENDTDILNEFEDSVISDLNVTVFIAPGDLHRYSSLIKNDDGTVNIKKSKVFFKELGFTGCNLVDECEGEVIKPIKGVLNKDGVPIHSKAIVVQFSPHLYGRNEFCEDVAVYGVELTDEDCERFKDIEIIKKLEELKKKYKAGAVLGFLKYGVPTIGDFACHCIRLEEGENKIDPKKLLFVIVNLDETGMNGIEDFIYLGDILYGDDIDKVIKKMNSTEGKFHSPYNYWLWLEQWIDEGIEKGELKLRRAECMPLGDKCYVDMDRKVYCEFFDITTMKSLRGFSCDLLEEWNRIVRGED